MTPESFRALLERLRAVPIPDSDATLVVFATLAAEHGWTEAIATFDQIVAEHLPQEITAQLEGNA
jgi:hypothetical protein